MSHGIPLKQCKSQAILWGDSWLIATFIFRPKCTLDGTKIGENGEKTLKSKNIEQCAEQPKSNENDKKQLFCG